MTATKNVDQENRLDYKKTLLKNVYHRVQHWTKYFLELESCLK